MSGDEQTEASLTESIEALARSAREAGQGSVALKYAMAANALAEARAWLRHPDQPHGGQSYSDS